MDVEVDSEIIDAALAFEDENCNFSLIIVTETWGSSPRPAGSLMLVNQDGHMVGSASGGCVEGEIVFASSDTIRSGKSQLLKFGVTDENAWSVGLSCGGKISVFICPSRSIQPGLFSKMKSVEINRTFLSIECDLVNGTISEIQGTEKNYNLINKNSDYFLIDFIPKPRVFIVGGVQIAQHLILMAKESGFEVLVIDPRSQFASRKRFPDNELYVEWPDEALSQKNLSENDALVTLTHDPKIDDAAISYALSKPISCISCLGSKKTNSARINRLKNQGFSAKDLNRINAPAGIAIGSKTPAEIAVSILAQLIQNRRVVK